MLNWKNWFKPKQETRSQEALYGEEIISSNGDRIYVNEDSAIGVSAVFCAVNVIASTLASFPLITYKADSRDEATDHPLYFTLREQPNSYQDAPTFWETYFNRALLYGTGFAEVVSDLARSNTEFHLIDPTSIEVKIDSRGVPTYKQGQTTLPIENLLILMGLSPDGSKGYELLRTAQDTIGFSIACEKFGKNYFENMTHIGGTLNSPDKVNPDKRQILKQSWRGQFAGIKKVGSVPLLDEGITFNPYKFDNNAGIYQESRAYQIGEVSRLFNINPIRLHDLGRATWNNITTLNAEFYSITLRPWLIKMEAQLNRKLFPNRDYYVKFDVDDYLRGDWKTRIEVYKTAIESGIYEVNEIRKWEDLPPIEEKVSQDQAMNQTLQEIANGNAIVSDQIPQ